MRSSSAALYISSRNAAVSTSHAHDLCGMGVELKRGFATLHAVFSCRQHRVCMRDPPPTPSYPIDFASVGLRVRPSEKGECAGLFSAA